MKIRHRVLSLFLVLASASLAYAQVTSAVLQGVVTDSQGGVLPGVTVTVTNTETGLAREVVSERVGFYRLAALPPGTYALAATLDGFTPFARTGLVLTVGQTATVDVQAQSADAHRSGHRRRDHSARRHLVERARHDGDEGAARRSAAGRS